LNSFILYPSSFILSRVLLIAFATGPATTDAPPVSGPAGAYTVRTGGPTRITSGPTWVRLDWTIDAQAVQPPAPDPPAAATAHTGHFTVSYVEPRYPSPASAAVRDGLARIKATGIDTTYRSYVEGQTQLATLGFTAHYKPADLPIVFLQEDQAGGSPIIGSLRSPASADAVVAWVKGFRGR